jgi:UDP-N-acetyl-D-glucosamine dehydrogenase
LNGVAATFSEALAAIRARRARVGVIGLGYVGLPLVKLFVRAGFPVVGFDCDPVKVAKLNAGESYIKHIAAEDLAALRRQGRFQATTDMGLLRGVQAIVI